ncbi:hypothetical protein DQ353_10995 [Arthrobacter sp. AQ5-05]|uniref:hypothetical protein n=1 Tax=Arthrobacter sp. AQ5-05 TaxID=2184581 RepID=UPI000DCF22D7|nr:hypothetical protein [Arthrobacter sp. AQ5-05]RAX49308.1 hypothetical protein DQ353_10995 [Arthrobacter sp. AQ5-05]
MIVLGLFGPIGSELLYFLLLTFVVGFYLHKTGSGAHRSTWGKRRMGLGLIGIEGSVPKRTKILLRTVVKPLPWENAHFFIWQLMGVIHREGKEATPGRGSLWGCIRRRQLPSSTSRW